jgi:hypothetical protein
MKNRYLYIPILLSMMCLMGCGGGGHPLQPAPQPTPEQLQASYHSAIQDAAVAEPDEIYTNLDAIVEYNDHLIWRGVAGGKEVLVATWTSWNGYATGTWNMGNFNAWVTVVPEVKDFCEKTSGDYVLRLEQLLGLPPHNGKLYFVEIWVSPDDMFRPSPDPEITDHEAEIDFPTYVDDAYKTWFNDLKAASYGPNGYPWTRLGYTYDWGNPESKVGLSEFVIKKNAVVEIKDIYTNNSYCR